MISGKIGESVLGRVLCNATQSVGWSAIILRKQADVSDFLSGRMEKLEHGTSGIARGEKKIEVSRKFVADERKSKVARKQERNIR